MPPPPSERASLDHHVPELSPLSPTYPPAPIRRESENGVYLRPLVPSPACPISHKGSPPWGSRKDLSAKDGPFTHNGRSDMMSGPVSVLPQAGGALLTLDNTASDASELYRENVTPREELADPYLRHTELWSHDELATVSNPAPAVPQYMGNSHIGGPENHQQRDDRIHVCDRRKRKREGQDGSIQPDDGPSKKKRKKKSMEPIFTHQHSPEVIFGDPPISTPAPLNSAVIEGVEFEYPMAMVGQCNSFQGVLGPTKKKSKSARGRVVAKRAKKRKNVDSGQHDGTDCGPLDVNGDTFKGLDQDLAQPGVDAPVPNYAVAPVNLSARWKKPVPTEKDKETGVHVLEPAPASRYTSGGTGKKKRCSVWHIWSEVRNCTLRNRDG